MQLHYTKYCRNCIYKGQYPNGTWGCAKTQLPINVDMDFCSKGATEGEHCDGCHQIIPKEQESFIVSRDDGGYLILCPSCYNRSSR